MSTASALMRRCLRPLPGTWRFSAGNAIQSVATSTNRGFQYEYPSPSSTCHSQYVRLSHRPFSTSIPSIESWNDEAYNLVQIMGKVSEDEAMPEATRLLQDLLNITYQARFGGSSMSSSSDHFDLSRTDFPLVLEILDAWVDLQAHQDLAFDETTEIGHNTLPVILQLWRQALDRGDHAVPTPTEMLARLDHYRSLPMLSSSIRPTAQAYNIWMEVAAERDVALALKVYHWMWTESQMDSLVQPDTRTVAAMFRGFVSLDDEDVAATECEHLREDYISQISSSNPQRRLHEIASVEESLIHVWAERNGFRALFYLEEMARKHLESPVSDPYPPPGTKCWNAVISSLAIRHEEPHEAEDVVKAFQQFAKQVPGNEDFFVQPDLYTYTPLLEGWARAGHPDDANRVFDRILRDRSRLHPNVITYTSAMKANEGNLDRVNLIATNCLQAFHEQLQRQAGAKEGEYVSNDIVLDHEFFHVWLRACFSSDNRSKGLATAEEILLDTMPAVGLSPGPSTFGLLLRDFLDQDDLEGATKWLMANAKQMDEVSIVDWTVRLVEMGDIELVSFLDRLFGSVRRQAPRSLLQVIVEEHLKDQESLERLLSRVSADQGLQILQWMPSRQRKQQCFALVLRTMAKSGDGSGAEELWGLWKEHSLKEPGVQISPQLTGEMYGSLIVAWSRDGGKVETNKDHTTKWFATWLKDPTVMDAYPPSQRIQAAVLSSLAAAFVPKQAMAFLRELKDLHASGKLAEKPDLVMHNLVLKAWIQAASGSQAEKFLENEMSDLDKDIISYNSVVHAYVKARELDRARNYIQDKMIDQGECIPDFSTFRLLLGGWVPSRNPDSVEQATSIVHWMEELHQDGILASPPDKSIWKFVEDCQSNKKMQKRRGGGNKRDNSRRKRDSK